jgi:WhiB family redox-sensing transcriptional regulator
MLTADSAAWRARAACVGRPTSWWFSADESIESARALRVCRDCTVRAECLTEALAVESSKGDMHGIRGGVTAQRRRSMMVPSR